MYRHKRLYHWVKWTSMARFREGYIFGQGEGICIYCGQGEEDICWGTSAVSMVRGTSYAVARVKVRGTSVVMAGKGGPVTVSVSSCR